MTWLVFTAVSPSRPIGRVTGSTLDDATDGARLKYGDGVLVFTRQQHRVDVHRRLVFDLVGCAGCQKPLARTAWMAKFFALRRAWWGFVRVVHYYHSFKQHKMRSKCGAKQIA